MFLCLKYSAALLKKNYFKFSCQKASTDRYCELKILFERYYDFKSVKKILTNHYSSWYRIPFQPECDKGACYENYTGNEHCCEVESSISRKY